MRVGKKLRKTSVTLGKTIYSIDERGTYHRVSPMRPYCGKRERRQVIKQRRLNKLQEAA